MNDMAIKISLAVFQALLGLAFNYARTAKIPEDEIDKVFLEVKAEMLARDPRDLPEPE